MGLKTLGRGSFRPEAYESRQLELTVAFDIEGVTALNPQGADWEAQKLAYGRQIAVQIADQVVPQMAAQLGVDAKSLPQPGVDSSSDFEGALLTGTVGETTLAVRQRIDGVFRLTGGREMTAGDLIFAARDSIAAAVADHAIFALEQRFEGIQASRMHFRLSRQNGEISEFQRTHVPPSPDGTEQPMAA